jgi:hypothetical protein
VPFHTTCQSKIEEIMVEKGRAERSVQPGNGGKGEGEQFGINQCGLNSLLEMTGPSSATKTGQIIWKE